MWELVQSGGWLMIPIIACSVITAAICVERFLMLRRARIAPRHLLAEVWGAILGGKLDAQKLKDLRQGSPLGLIFCAGLENSRHGRNIVKERIMEAGGVVSHELQRFLTALGIVAEIAPLLGLLGTVIGMIEVFTVIMVKGTGDPGILAGGISKALITTAAGLTVAIPALILHRFFSRRVDELVVILEQEANKLVEALFSDRDVDLAAVGQ